VGVSCRFLPVKLCAPPTPPPPPPRTSQNLQVVLPPLKPSLPATAVDINHISFHVVCGYADGSVALYDVSSGKNLKVTQPNPGVPITQAKFLKPTGSPQSETQAITVASNGVVNKLAFISGLLGFSVDLDCLLDGTAGPVVGLATGDRCLALSSSKSSFVVVTEPSIRVVNKWPSPAYATGGIAAAAHKPDEQPMALPCLCWTKTKLEGNTTEMLCRGWGDKLQFLNMHLPDPDAPFPSFGSGSVYQLRGGENCYSFISFRHERNIY
jgi:hypothetical protein